MKNIFLIYLCILFCFSKAQNYNFQWVRGFGAFSQDEAKDMATDLSGNMFVLGYFTGTVDFDPSPAVYNLTSNGSGDIFICKLNPSGNFIWAKSFGGQINDYGHSIEIDKAGNIFLTGMFGGVADLDPGTGTYTVNSTGLADAFITKLDSSGNFIWTKIIEGDANDIGTVITTDYLGNIFVAGLFEGTSDLDPGPGSYPVTIAGPAWDTYVLKLDASGNFLWAKVIAGTNSDFIYQMRLDVAGNIYTTGFFGALTDFDPGPATYFLNASGNGDHFVCKMDASGNFLWAKSIGGNGPDSGFDLALDAFGNVYSSGTFSLTVDFDPGPGTYTMSSFGNADAFLSKLDASGNFLGAAQFGGAGADAALQLICSGGDLYMSGTFSSIADLDPGPLTYTMVSAGGTEIFICGMDTSFSFLWAKQCTGPGNDEPKAMLKTISNELYIAGRFQNVCDFDPGPGTYTLNGIGYSDAFVLKLGNSIISGEAETEKGINAFRLFPNPSGGKFTLQSDQEENILIYDIRGALLSEIKLDQIRGFSTEFNLSAGIYIVRGKTSTKKLVVTE